MIKKLSNVVNYLCQSEAYWLEVEFKKGRFILRIPSLYSSILSLPSWTRLFIS